MPMISDKDATAAYARVQALLAGEWPAIRATQDKAMIAAHGRLHWGLEDLADKFGIKPPAPDKVEPAAGGVGKPPKPD